MAESRTGHNGRDVALPADSANAFARGQPVLSTHDSDPGDGDSHDADVELLAVGAKVGRYIVVDRLGAGAMGVVYAAYDPKLDRKIALKLLRPQQGGSDQARRTARLEREAQAIAKLSHPNVVGIFDVVVHDDRVVLAMEYLGGGTLRDWVAAKKRPWREILKVFIEVGKGLAAAHAEGQIHRDFKPDNVLLDKNGVPKVVDFGLVRLTSLTGSTTDSKDDEIAEGAGLALGLPGSDGSAALTRTGAISGTPAYMAPEQFLGRAVDARTDQFAFCVSLYEALYGERPFAGSTVIALADSVTRGRTRETSKDSDVPGWVRRAILRGLEIDSAHRFATIDLLVAILDNDPAVKRRRRLVAAGAIGLVVTSLIVAQQMVIRRRAEADREIAHHLQQAENDLAAARAKVAEAREVRQRALAAFDGLDRQQGESLWRQSRALVPAADRNYDQAERTFDSGFMLDQSRVDIRAKLADARYEHLLFAEDFRIESRIGVLEERLAAVDADGSRRRALILPGTLVFRTRPVASSLILERYERDTASGVRTRRLIGPLNATSSAMSIAPGSYRVAVDGPGLAHIVYPFELRRGEHILVDLLLPAATAVPEGFVYVPPGGFWFGEADEQLRTQFLDTVPIHRRHVDPYLIAKEETTYKEWIAFLDGLPASERGRRAPDVSTAARGSLRLRGNRGTWQLEFQPTTRRYKANMGDLVVYEKRKQNISQDWLQFPVTGISLGDVDRYLAWLRTSGRVPNARLCTEVEWEHAARGADDRVFPHGDDLQPQDANFDLTYGRIGQAYGPDAVSSHPASRSPFDLDDMVGNALELVVSSQKRDELVIRGGGYYFGAASCRSTNREAVPTAFRDVVTGIRVCASFQGVLQ